MILMVLVAVVLALSVLLLGRALRPPQTSLGEQLTRVGAQNATDPLMVSSTHQGRSAALHRWLSQQLAASPVLSGMLDDKLRRDLSLLSIDPASFTASRVLIVVAGFLASLLAAGSIAVAFAASAPGLVALSAALGLTFVAYLMPARRVAARAKARRGDFRAAITSYMDLVAMRAASGAGTAEALHDAAHIGHGWPLARVRLALADARVSGYSPDRALGHLGEEIGMHELEDLSAQLLLGSLTGAQAEVTLRERARSLRDAQLASAQGKAGERSQTMVIAQLLLGVGFILFVLYPPISNFMTAL